MRGGGRPLAVEPATCVGGFSKGQWPLPKLSLWEARLACGPAFNSAGRFSYRNWTFSSRAGRKLARPSPVLEVASC